MKRSDWYDKVPFEQRKYNGILVQETEQTYYNKIASLYSSAVVSLINIPIEKYKIIQSLIDDAVECQNKFEMADEKSSDYLLSSLNYDYQQTKIRSLKDDYNYLCFVRGCTKIQIIFLNKFKEIVSQYNIEKPKETENKPIENEPVKKEVKVKVETKTEEVIKGVKGLALYLKIGITKAQEILNSEILQNNGVAYRVGNGWNINAQKLDELLSKDSDLLKKHKMKS